jgi:glycosyltransferase involved in cell wall biosynthesis
VLKVALLVPYNRFIPPHNGGTNRAFHTAYQLSRYFDLSLLSQQANIPVESSLSNSVINIVSCDRYSSQIRKYPRWLIAVYSRLLFRTLKSAGSSNLLFYESLNNGSFLNNLDAVVFTTLANVDLARWIRRNYPKVALIANTENVEHKYWQQIYQRTGDVKAKQMSSTYLSVEKRIGRIFDGWVACSDDDFRCLEMYIDNTGCPSGVACNGVDVRSAHFFDDVKLNQNPNLVFCGDLTYSPNLNAIQWFLEHVWRELKLKWPDAKLRVVGKKPADLEIQKHNFNDVDFLGYVDNIGDIYSLSSIAIVPIFEGSGSRLKILDAFAHGVPVIATSVGASGLQVEVGRHFLLADTKSDFMKSIAVLMENEDFYKYLRINARKLVVTNYDWSVVVQPLVDVVTRCVNAKS